MIRFITFVMLMFASLTAYANMKVVEVLDGDSIRITAPFLPPELGKTLILRVRGVDTPEKGLRAKCSAERVKSHEALRFTKEFIKSGKPEIILFKWDKYGGRVIGDISINAKYLSEELLRNNLAREYSGGTKNSWCF